MNKKLFFTALSVAVSATVMAEGPSEPINCTVQPLYGHRNDGKPGRIVAVELQNKELQGKVSIEVEFGGKKESVEHVLQPENKGKFDVMLPADVPTGENSKVNMTIRLDGKDHKKTLAVEPMRHWNIYLYNHSHVDIGYTNTHKNLEILHKTNILEGIKLAEETKDFVDGAKYIWNPEVTWPIERLWESNPEDRGKLIEAIKKGQIEVDASYLNLNTSTCSDEELFHILSFSRKLQKLSGKPVDVFQQFDIPGISWGCIPVFAQEGIKYVMSWPNSDRGGNARAGNIDGRPFWWVGPDGESKVLFFQPGRYANSGSMGGKGASTGRPWFGQRDPEKVPAVIKTGHANVNFVKKTVDLEKKEYPYDFLVLSWSLWDNNPIDADVPYAVKEWNEKYAYPKIIICGGHEIMSMIESKYGKDLPVVKGDFTEYWTDGLGSAADMTAINRNAKERLTQAETIWSMLAKGKKAPRKDLNEAWRYIALGSEHTWCFENPKDSYFTNAILKVKKSYFNEAQDRSIALLDEALAPVTDKSDGALGPVEGPSKGGVAVFNTHTWQYSGLVTLSKLESPYGDKVVDSAGKEVPSQRLSTGDLVFFAADVPALGSRHYRMSKGESSFKDGCKLNQLTMDNGLLSVTLDEKTGNIVKLTKTGSDYNYINTSVDGGSNSFSWLPANKNEPKADTDISISVVENGPLVVELRVDSKATGCRAVSRSVRLVHGQPWVETSNMVDKSPLMEKDSIHFGFGFNIPNSKTMVDIPWGIMEVEKDQWPQANRNWLAMQRWLDVSNDTHGVTWSSLDAPLFEYGDRYANISLSWGAKGPWQKKLEQSSTIYSWVMNNHWHTNFPLTQEGPVTFRYRIMPHEGGYDPVASNRFGLQQAQPLVQVAANNDPDIKSAFEIDNKKVYATILKSSDRDNELLVRLRSLSDTPETLNLSYPSRKPDKVYICQLEEDHEKEVEGPVSMKPFGQLTLKLTYK